MQGKWIFTFNDMITLLLTFFVLLLSISHIETAKVRDVAKAAKKVMGLREEPSESITVIESIIPTIKDPEIERAKFAALRKKIPAAEALYLALQRVKGLKIIQKGRSLLVTLPEMVLFPSGEARITSGGQRVLLTMAEICRESTARIRVEGHTDDVPISSHRYPSNWELSLARAVEVVKFLIEKGKIEPARLSASGYAETKPRVQNRSEEGRRLNRRVELVLIFP